MCVFTEETLDLSETTDSADQVSEIKQDELSEVKEDEKIESTDDGKPIQLYFSSRIN